MLVPVSRVASSHGPLLSLASFSLPPLVSSQGPEQSLPNHIWYILLQCVLDLRIANTVSSFVAHTLTERERPGPVVAMWSLGDPQCSRNDCPGLVLVYGKPRMLIDHDCAVV
jgi:hypothetical protein